MGVSQNSGYHDRGPNNKDYSILGSILGFPYFGKLPYKTAGLEFIQISGLFAPAFSSESSSYARDATNMWSRN